MFAHAHTPHNDRMFLDSSNSRGSNFRQIRRFFTSQPTGSRTKPRNKTWGLLTKQVAKCCVNRMPQNKFYPCKKTLAP